MAKKRKASKKRHYRRIGATKSKIDLMEIGLAVGGAVAARILSNKLANSSNDTLKKFGIYVPLAAGVVLPMVVKNPMIKSLSVGLVAQGGVEALGQNGLKVISGMDVISRVSYPKQLPYRAVAGLPNGVKNTAVKSPSLNVIAGVI